MKYKFEKVLNETRDRLNLTPRIKLKSLYNKAKNNSKYNHRKDSSLVELQCDEITPISNVIHTIDYRSKILIKINNHSCYLYAYIEASGSMSSFKNKQQKQNSSFEIIPKSK